MVAGSGKFLSSLFAKRRNVGSTTGKIILPPPLGSHSCPLFFLLLLLPHTLLLDSQGIREGREKGGGMSGGERKNSSHSAQGKEGRKEETEFRPPISSAADTPFPYKIAGDLVCSNSNVLLRSANPIHQSLDLRRTDGPTCCFSFRRRHFLPPKKRLSHGKREK